MHKGSLQPFGRAHNEGNIPPPGTHSGVKGLHYAILGQGYTAIHRVVFKYYGGLIIAVLPLPRQLRGRHKKVYNRNASLVAGRVAAV